MKVLKEGNWKNPWSKEMVCVQTQCGATLLAEEGDVKGVDYSNRNDFYVTCTVCGAQLPVSEKDLPLRVQQVLNKKRKYSTYDD